MSCENTIFDWDWQTQEINNLVHEDRHNLGEVLHLCLIEYVPFGSEGIVPYKTIMMA